MATPSELLLRQMDNDSVSRDQWGRYLLPDPVTGKLRAWTRVTTIAKTLSDQYALMQWQNRMVAHGMTSDLLTEAKTCDPATESGMRKLQTIVDTAKETAGMHARADQGTDFHLERMMWEENGRPALDTICHTPELRLYAKLMADVEVDTEYMERIIILPKLGVAGTFDSLIKVEAGETLTIPHYVVGDIKTGKTKHLQYTFGETAIQLALYAHGKFIWTGTEYIDMPPIDQTTAQLIHVPIGEGRATLWDLDIHDGWEVAVYLCLKVREWRKRGYDLASLRKTVVGE